MPPVASGTPISTMTPMIGEIHSTTIAATANDTSEPVARPITSNSEPMR